MKKYSSTHKRVVFLGIVLTTIFAALAARLSYIQIARGSAYGQKALAQRSLPIVIDRVRGHILDRNGIYLTKRKHKSLLLIFPDCFEDKQSLFKLIGPMAKLEMHDFNDLMRENTPYIKREIQNPDPETEKLIQQGNYPGLMIIHISERYDEHSIARHLIGYLKESDKTPQSGIESIYDEYLSSDDTLMVYAITDAKKRVLPGTDFRLSRGMKKYYDIELTIDYYIQEALEGALDAYAKKAGGVILDIETGNILALASRPNFDQNDIGSASEHEDSLWAVPTTAFAPGSLFKTIIATVGIERGLCHGDTPYSCQGGIFVGGVRYNCHLATGGLGNISMRQAFAHSCNDAFISLAQRVGGDAIIEMANRFGFGQSLFIAGLKDEGGILPSKLDYAGPGIGNLALGQGKVEITAIQAAQMMAIIGGGGVKRDLSLIKALIDQSGKTIEGIYKNQPSKQVIRPDTAQELISWMGDVTEYGTGMNADSQKVGGIAGKTGTPQIHGDLTAGHYGWFAGFFPKDSPKYAMAILVREESAGGERAAMIFKETAEMITLHTDSLKIP